MLIYPVLIYFIFNLLKMGGWSITGIVRINYNKLTKSFLIQKARLL